MFRGARVGGSQCLEEQEWRQSMVRGANVRRKSNVSHGRSQDRDNKWCFYIHNRVFVVDQNVHYMFFVETMSLVSACSAP